MQDILNEAPCGYFSFFDDGALHVVNKTLCDLLGYEKQELQKKTVETIFTISTKIFFQTHFFPLVKMQGHAEEIFISLLTKDKQHLPILLNATRNETNGRVFTACACIVVANRKKFEDELIAARNSAEKALRENSELIKAKTALQHHAEKLDEQIQLVNRQNHELKQINHVVTHSLREPLRKVLTYTEIIQDNPSLQCLEKNLPKLITASKQMHNIVSGLQQYVWLNDTALSSTPTDLEAILKKVLQQLREKEDQLILHTDPLPVIKADSQQIELLFFHLLSNAIKFKKSEKAVITLSCSIIQQNSFRKVENKYKYKDFAKLQFRDEGIGFDPVFKEEIFELFKKLHQTEGSGLGLALCKKIVDNHFGTIAATSNRNEGATITVVLPLDATSE
jgi:sigma-B regulation protein RsbU (phosphoserine phosphatase)